MPCIKKLKKLFNGVLLNTFSSAICPNSILKGFDTEFQTSGLIDKKEEHFK